MDRNDSELSAVSLSESMRLCEEASAQQLILRLVGSLAIYHHCSELRHLLASLDRRPFRDIDFVGRAEDSNKILDFFTAEGYAIDPSLIHSQEFGLRRLIFEHPARQTKVDVFLDKLQMSHNVDFAGRLELDSPTVTLADLLLSKLQIHEITENDFKDIIVLLAEHDFSEGDGEVVDVPYIARLLSRDWGFCHTASKNIELTINAVSGYDALGTSIRSLIQSRLQHLADCIEAEPKGRQWRLRARIGERWPWYEEVGEVSR